MTNEQKIIAELRKKFHAEIKKVMEMTGNNFEDTQFIIENALDLALNDERNEIYN